MKEFCFFSSSYTAHRRPFDRNATINLGIVYCKWAEFCLRAFDVDEEQTRGAAGGN